MPVLHAIDPLRVLHVKGLQCSMQAIGRTWHDDQMDVIRHQAVGENLDSVPGREGAQQGQVRVPVVVAEEDRATAVAPLGDVMRYAWDDDTRNTRHAYRLDAPARIVPARICRETRATWTKTL